MKIKVRNLQWEEVTYGFFYFLKTLLLKCQGFADNTFYMVDKKTSETRDKETYE